MPLATREIQPDPWPSPMSERGKDDLTHPGHASGLLSELRGENGDSALPLYILLVKKMAGSR